MKQDGYVNATILSKASGKRLDKWYQKIETQHKIQQFNKLPYFGHIASKHTKTSKHHCVECNRYFPSKMNFEKHKQKMHFVLSFSNIRNDKDKQTRNMT